MEAQTVAIDILPVQEILALLMVHQTASVVTQASLDGFNYPLTTYVDASLGSEHTKGKSPTGVIVCHYGSPIIWTSHLQSVPGRSLDYGVGNDGNINGYATHFVRKKCFCWAGVRATWTNESMVGQPVQHTMHKKPILNSTFKAYRPAFSLYQWTGQQGCCQ